MAIKLLLNFPRIKKLTEDPETLKNILKDFSRSSQCTYELDESQERIRKKHLA